MKGSRLIIASFATVVIFGCGQKSPDARSPSEPAGPHAGLIAAPPVTNLALLSNPSAPQGPESADIEAVQADVRRNFNAVYAGDVDTVLELTHPKIIELMGGASQARAVLEKMLREFKSSGMKLEVLTFPEKPSFAKSDAHDFAIVPTKSTIVVKGQRLESLNYQFGVRERGAAKWTYIEGSRITAANVGTFFPDFPSNYQFPRVYRKKL